MVRREYCAYSSEPSALGLASNPIEPDETSGPRKKEEFLNE
jgi:hypothetical protein